MNNRNSINKKKTKLKKWDELTEIERINEGLRQPYLVVPNFKKTEEERELLKRMKTSGRWPKGGIPKFRDGIEVPVIVHLINKAKEDRNKFKTTYSFKFPMNKVEENLFRYFGEKLNSLIRKIYVNGKLYSHNG